jgi:hypothetical protein
MVAQRWVERRQRLVEQAEARLQVARARDA